MVYFPAQSRKTDLDTSLQPEFALWALPDSFGYLIYDAQNRVLGVLNADIHLLKLSDFLRSLDISQYGQIFIVERDGNLIANSNPEKPFTLIENKISRLKAIDSPNPTLQQIAKQIQSAYGLQSISQPTDMQVDVEGEHHFVQIVPWRDPYGLDWLVVMSVPDRAFIAQIQIHTRIIILLCFGALLLASVMGVLTARWIARPILRLNQASESMAAGNLDQTVAMSSIQELNTLSKSFNDMVKQLRTSFIALEARKEKLENRVAERTVELKNTLEELQRTQSQVIQSEKMASLGQLVAGVAHEINNPVNFIHANLIYVQEYIKNLLGIVRLYQHYNPTPAPEICTTAEEIDLAFLQEDLPKMLNSMQIGTDRIRQIVLSLRTFSHMNEADFKAVKIHDGFDSSLMILKHRLTAKPNQPDIQIVKDYAELPLVECYAGQLNQVFMNILVNAIDAIEERAPFAPACSRFNAVQCSPQITIRTSIVDEAWIKVAIADNGVGIPEPVRQRIFDPFFTAKPPGKGTGMGMAISYQIITEKHGGKLECFSTPGEGTEFIMQIPVRQKADEAV